MDVIPECDILCLKLGHHKQEHKLGKGFVGIETGCNFFGYPNLYTGDTCNLQAHKGARIDHAAVA